MLKFIACDVKKKCVSSVCQANFRRSFSILNGWGLKKIDVLDLTQFLYKGYIRKMYVSFGLLAVKMVELTLQTMLRIEILKCL